MRNTPWRWPGIRADVQRRNLLYGWRGQCVEMFKSPCPWICRLCPFPWPCGRANNLCHAPPLRHRAERSQCLGGAEAGACWEQVAAGTLRTAAPLQDCRCLRQPTSAVAHSSATAEHAECDSKEPGSMEVLQSLCGLASSPTLCSATSRPVCASRRPPGPRPTQHNYTINKARRHVRATMIVWRLNARPPCKMPTVANLLCVRVRAMKGGVNSVTRVPHLIIASID